MSPRRNVRPFTRISVSAMALRSSYWPLGRTKTRSSAVVSVPAGETLFCAPTATATDVLRKEGFEVAVCPTGPDAIEAFDRNGADLVLLDLMLPGLPGSEVCRSLREKSNVPVIMLTAKDGEIDKVVGLELGADDYVTKPFSSRELVARMRAVLRRRGEPDDAAESALESGPVRMDVDRHVVTVRGGTVQLPLKEFELLQVLLRNADRVLTRMQLIDRVWGADYVGDTKTLDVHIKRLRAKIEVDPAHPQHIVTVRGLGYKFESAA